MLLYKPIIHCDDTYVLIRYLRVTKTALQAMKPFLQKLDAVKEPSHIVAGHALIRSLFPDVKSKTVQRRKGISETL
jgi:hypothetical protein